ncbi:hypothetical protein LOH54_07645 [Sulfurimonas sp. HSL-3221]|uniref:hypothetical protein n=1 Tax=Sulfurimonadaceae TaxID=2771471 RepID=UPI001E5CA617|nr:hypothetical protein [Sulfurimonas sp. HSL-3221]UFS61534.1 hypothetical protein LOH54_07645 [Sulfurimonas sp. HSL-3221]
MSETAQRFEVLIKKHYYIYERYGVDVTFALLHHSEPLDLQTLGGFLRLSDHLEKIDDNHYFIVFDFTDAARAHKASQNLLCKLDDHFRNDTTYIAMDSFDTSKNAQIVLSRLQQILVEIRKSPRKRIDNEQILDGRT